MNLSKKSCWNIMKIKLLSDLHEEFERWPHQKEYHKNMGAHDVLVLAGDINSSRNLETSLRFFIEAGNDTIVYVPGNHEYYGSSMLESERQFLTAKFALELEFPGTKVHVLNPGCVTINEVVFIGGCLWTDFSEDWHAEHAAKTQISDFSYIPDFSPSKAKAIQFYQLQYFKKFYEIYSGQKIVFISHFLPAYECIAERYRGPDLLNKYFANDLSNWIANLSNSTWLFGHSHHPMDIKIGDTRVISNPLGYKNENKLFNPHKIIEI